MWPCACPSKYPWRWAPTPGAATRFQHIPSPACPLRTLAGPHVNARRPCAPRLRARSYSSAFPVFIGTDFTAGKAATFLRFLQDGNYLDFYSRTMDVQVRALLCAP